MDFPPVAMKKDPLSHPIKTEFHPEDDFLETSVSVGEIDIKQELNSEDEGQIPQEGSFNQGCTMERREKRYPQEKRLQCQWCSREFHLKGKLQIHIRIHTGERPYVCNVCGKGFAQNKSLKKHLKIHALECPYMCIKCGEGFTLKTNFEMHNRMQCEDKRLHCEYCYKVFYDKSKLKKHIKIHTEKPYMCDTCGNGVLGISVLKDHDYEAPRTAEKIFKCEFCNEGFYIPSQKRFPCEFCDKVLGYKDSLLIHLRIHTGERPYVCCICGKGFMRRKTLERHEATHSDLQRICKFCNRAFTNEKEYIMHLSEFHGEERCHVCGVCGKRLSSKGNLEDHKATHSGEKNFHCEFCNKSFFTRKSLNKHLSKRCDGVCPNVRTSGEPSI